MATVGPSDEVLLRRDGKNRFIYKQDLVELTFCLWVFEVCDGDLFSHQFRIFAKRFQTTPHLKLSTPLTLKKAIKETGRGLLLPF